MIREKKRKSVVIPSGTLGKIRKAYQSFRTKVEAEEAIGVNFRVLDKIMLQDTCSPDTLETIKNYLEPVKQTA